MSDLATVLERIKAALTEQAIDYAVLLVGDPEPRQAVACKLCDVVSEVGPNDLKHTPICAFSRIATALGEDDE